MHTRNTGQWVNGVAGRTQICDLQAEVLCLPVDVMPKAQTASYFANLGISDIRISEISLITIDCDHDLIPFYGFEWRRNVRIN